ncbi:DUF5798 family protein [Halobium salinum]|uniref:DUF5798 family protein n=1 Tax=Halobium salinum TaxID=1364940 RepID=A0ABD5P768_9EURY|nr:DUF5798 family protein [Halobium salinum]
MGLGGTAKKIQKVAEMAEDVYQRLNEMREELRRTKETVEMTKDRVDSLESEVVEQRALVAAIAEEQGLDVDSIRATAHVDEAERSGDDASSTDAGGASTDADADTESETPAEETTRGANPSEAPTDGD